MLCTQQREDMDLGEDHMELENIEDIQDVMVVDMAVNALIALGDVINWLVPFKTLRLSGGYAEEDNMKMVLGPSPMPLIPRFPTIMDFIRRPDISVPVAKYVYDTGMELYNRRKRRGTLSHFEKDKKKPKIPMPTNGVSMLEWKNSLTKMYHTFQWYNFSAIKKCANPVGTLYTHYTSKGQGPGLYWVFTSDIAAASGTDRNASYNLPQYYDGGMFDVPTNAVSAPFVPKKNFGVGATGVIYVFSADWPGNTMNPDPLTQDAASTYKYLSWADYEYAGTMVNQKNFPRKWVDVFANTNWTYLTIYGCSYRFDITNISPQPYVVEIMTFSFKADVDAMDYEKQAIAPFGGIHLTQDCYFNNLNYLPISDINIIKRKRYYIKGMNTMIFGGAALNAYEGNRENSKIIKWNIKRKYVIKRPVLNSLETSITDEQIFKTYYEAQKGIYFHIMAWPMEVMSTVTLASTGLVNNIAFAQTANLPENTGVGVAPTRIAPCLDVKCYKKSWFKLDETAANF